MAQRDLTRAAEILAGKAWDKRGTNPCPTGTPWDNGTAWDSQHATGSKPAPTLDSSVPPTDGTTRDNVSVPLSHHPLGVGHGTRGTADGVRTASASCAQCVRVTRYGNCGEPVAAGLVEHFGLVRHPDEGRGCVAFAGEPGGDRRAPAHFPIGTQHLGHRLACLLAAGAINDDEAELVRERFDVHSAEEWLTLLGWCEAAVRDVAPARSAEAPSAPAYESPGFADRSLHATHVPTQHPSAERSLFD